MNPDEKEPSLEKEEIVFYATTKQGKRKKITFTSRKPLKKESNKKAGEGQR